MIERLNLGRWHVAKSTVQTPVIPPVDPLSGCKLDLLERAPRASLADQLGLVEAVHRLGQRVVIRISARADRTYGTGLRQPLRVADSEVLGGFNWPSQHRVD